jgi:hypothetical protein
MKQVSKKKISALSTPLREKSHFLSKKLSAEKNHENYSKNIILVNKMLK